MVALLREITLYLPISVKFNNDNFINKICCLLSLIYFLALLFVYVGAAILWLEYTELGFFRIEIDIK